jgi:hypothetical protein
MKHYFTNLKHYVAQVFQSFETLMFHTVKHSFSIKAYKSKN